MLAISASLAIAGPLSLTAADVPTCFPIADTLEVLASNGLLAGQVVVLEEHSACNGEPFAPTRPVPPAAMTGRDAVTWAVEHARTGERTYSMEERAGALLIAPDGARVVDVLVDVQAETFDTVYMARASIYSQLAIKALIWIPPGGNPFEVGDPVGEPNRVSLVETPFLEAFQAVQSPHEKAAVGFVLRVDDSAEDALGRKRACLTVLREQVLPPELLLPLGRATPETASRPRRVHAEGAPRR